MNVASRFKFETVSNLPLATTALYMLAEPSVPDEARDEAVNRAEAGERIGKAKAREIVGRHAEPAHKPAAAPDPGPDYFGPEPPRGDAWEGDDEPTPAQVAAIVAAHANDPSPDEVPRDYLIAPCPEATRAVFADAPPVFRRAVNQFRKALETVKDITDLDGSERLSYAEVRAYTEKIILALKAAEPYVNCPDCDGRARGCAGPCGKTGWIPRGGYDSLTPEQKAKCERFLPSGRKAG
jgi:hypothetical protein